MAVMVLAVVLGGAGAAWAENECGVPEAGTPVVCSAANYDAAADGNIVYRPCETHRGDFTLRLSDDLTVSYDRHDPDDDQLVFPGAGEPLYTAVRIETDAEHEGDVSFFSSADVTSNARGISVAHYGKSGALRTELTGGSLSIAGDWGRSYAVHSYRGDEFDANDEFSGNHDVIVRGVEMNLQQEASAGVVAVQYVDGDLNVAVQDSAIRIDSPRATGVWSVHDGAGDVDLELRDVDMDIRGPGGIDGLYGYHIGIGDTDIVARGVDIEVHGDQYSNGIAYAYWTEDAEGNLSIDAEDVDITVVGERLLDGIWGAQQGTGDIDVDVRGAAILTVGADSGGMSFVHDGNGDIDIAASGVDIKVRGDRSVGIGGGHRYDSAGNIVIDVRDASIAARGESVAGIRSFHMSGQGSIAVSVDGGSIVAEGPGSSGILVGLTGRIFGDRTGPIKAPAGGEVAVEPSAPGDIPDAGGNAPQSVLVNARVRGGTGVGAGVRLHGGGRVEIGPRGSVGAASGVAVRAEGEGSELHVDVGLDGRQPSEAIAGEIRNDDGRTTIVVNGTTLHDGTAGATGFRAPHGARDVTLATGGAIVGRAFSVADFATPFAPRAAVYEALPGFMLRLENRDAVGRRLRRPGSPVWARLSVGGGSYAPHGSRVGAGYDMDRFAVEAGLELALSGDGNATGWASLRHVRGLADVSAPTGGGEIKAAGFGASVGVFWKNAAGFYADGRISLTRYETDLRSDRRGLLLKDVGATIQSLGIEAGRRFSITDHLSLAPQAWLTRSDISMNDFRDAVGSQVSLAKADRSIGGLGIITESAHAWDDGERKLVLHGRVGLEGVLGDVETVAQVSGERLGSQATRTWGVLGLGAAYRWDCWSLDAEVSASGAGTDDSSYAASVRLVAQF
ncbi:MAG: autotransporter domain-containing protein [Candidatus Tectomicrobia bacterium]|nr:autotransporter domain-containing protein [Candidatus Tectomicrobia bacterium]